MLNHIVIMGRLTKDPELRYTQSQLPVAGFSIACERDRAPQGAERETDFVDIVAWRGTAEFVSKYFTKGSMIVVSGRLQLRDWTDRVGNKRRSAEIVADNVYFGESKRRDDSGSQQGSFRQNNSYSAPPQDPSGGYQPPPGSYSAPPAQEPMQQGRFADLDDDGELPF